MADFDVKSNIWKMYLIAFLRNLHFFGAMVIPFFLEWSRLDYTKIFILEASYMFWIFVLEIPTGVVADKFGRKISIVLGGVLTAVSFLLFGFFDDYRIFFIAEFLGAFGFTLFSGADKALLYDSLIVIKKENDSKKFFSRYESASTVGMIVGFPVGSLIVGSNLLSYPYSLAFTFTLTGLITVVSIYIALTLKEPKRKKVMGDLIKEGVYGFKYIFKHKKLRLFAINFALISAVTSFMFWFYQSLLGLMDVNIIYNGFIGAGFNLFSIFLLMNISHIEKILGLRNTLFYSAFIPGLLFIGLFFFKNIYFVFVAMFVIIGLKIMRGADGLGIHAGKPLIGKSR